MSLINQVLQDLEARRGEAVMVNGSPLTGLSHSGAGRAATAANRWLIGALVALLVVIAVLLLWTERPPWPGSGLAPVEASPRQSPPVVRMTVEPMVPVPAVVEAPPAVSALAPPTETAPAPAVALPRSAMPVVAKPMAALETEAAPLPAPAVPAPPHAELPRHAKIQDLRVRSASGRTRLLLDLDRAITYRTNLHDGLLTLSLINVDGGLASRPAIAGTPVRGVEARTSDGVLTLAFRLDAAQTLRGASLEPHDGGAARLVVELQAETPPAEAVVEKQLRPLTSAQRADQALRRAVVQLGQGRQAEAEQGLIAALKYDPGQVRARETLGALYLNSGRRREAETVLREGLRLAPQAALLARLFARLMVDQGDLTSALAALERARPPLAGEADYHALLAALYQRAGRHAEAVQTYRLLLQLRPDTASWWMGLGISLEAKGEPAPALQAYRQARQYGAGLDRQVLAYVEGRIQALTPRSPRPAADEGG